MYDIGIIGAGPAGYSAAIRAAQYGFSVVLFEKKDIGGTCLNRGCIPTKAMLHSVEVLETVKTSGKYGISADNITYDYSKILQRKDTITEKIKKSLTQLICGYGIKIVNEEAQIISQTEILTDSEAYECKNIIIATGSKPNKFQFEGFYPDDFVLDSDDILKLESVPKNILIVGSGAIGIEWARIFSGLDTKVSIIELAERLIPLADEEISQRVERIFKRNRIQFFTSTSVERIENNKVLLTNGKEIETDCILLAAGRSPELLNNDFSKTIQLDKYIKTDNNFKTNYDNIYAIGDVNGRSMLAHSAIHQATEVIEHLINNADSTFDRNKVPSVIYGSPEIAWIGKTEKQLTEENLSYKKSFFPLAALGKAYADDKIEGFVKILANEKEILGAHIIGEEASAMIQQVAIAIQNKTSPKQISEVIFAHPTYSEGLYEAVLGLDNIALHLPQAK